MRFEESLVVDETSGLRKRLEYDDEATDGLVLIADEQLRFVDGRAKVVDALTLEWTPHEVEWLHQKLGELLQCWRFQEARDKD